MGVVATDRWLRTYWQKAKNAPIHLRYFLQFDTIVKHPHSLFPHNDRREIHETLLMQGMFLPESDIGHWLRSLLERNVWKFVENEYEILRKQWQGPEAIIYLLPVNEENDVIMNELGGKTGISFFDKIFLFVSSKTKHSGIQALLTHEYHHTCRLAQLGKSERELTLLDSIIIEGLAEFAVYERLGGREIGKWTTMYREQELQAMWEAIFRERLHIRGKDNHHIFLYGNEEMRIPKWAGYALGYALVQSCHLSTKELLTQSSQQILKSSRFYQSRV